MVSRVLRVAMVALLIVTAGSTGAVSFAEVSEANESIGSTGVDTDTSPGPVGGSNNAVITTLLTLGAQDTVTMVCQNSESVTNSQVFNTKITAVTIGSASFTATP